MMTGGQVIALMALLLVASALSATVPMLLLFAVIRRQNEAIMDRSYRLFDEIMDRKLKVLAEVEEEVGKLTPPPDDDGSEEGDIIP